MKKLQLLRTLRHHIRLSEKRSPVYEQNKTAKFIIYLMTAFAFIYMVFISVMLALIANDSDTTTAYEFFFALLPFFLVVDFLFRFIGQQTPVQQIKPYTLLPIPKYTCVELFIFSSVITPNNLIWMAITVPYTVMTMLFSEGFFASLGLVLSFQLIITINSQWYMLMRTLINRSIKWWVVPIILYGIIFSPFYFDKPEILFDTFSYTGTGFAFWNPLNYLCVIIILAAFIEINKRLQFHFTTIENSNAENAKMKKVYEFRMLNRYGEIGEYLKLEAKSMMRNKNVRKTLLFGTVFMTALSLIISFTDIYQDNFSRVFWVVYTFVLYGAMMLIKIMSAEGNYIDGLMIHKENIMQLLKAKYYFYSALLILPFILMLPTVFTGKYSLLMLLSMMCFSAGPVYCLLMQMAVYNRQTIPLNTKFISKGNIETNYFQVVAELAAMFMPVVLISLLKCFFSENVTFAILLVTGIVFVILHGLWIKNIYRRFMNRRYKNMESFRATR